MLSIFIFSISDADEWKIYSNPSLGYEIHYPAQGKITATGENIKNNFYLDPLQPVSDLSRLQAFSRMTLDSRSLVQITFPDQYLIMLVLDHAPSDTPLPGAKPITMGSHTFYQQHSGDAAMCHHYDYDTYFLKRDSRYYVFIFLLTAGCSDVQPRAKSKDFTYILNTFNFL